MAADEEARFQIQSARRLAEQWADEAARLAHENDSLKREIARLRAAQGEAKMSGKLKKALAILAALGISASAVTDFLNHLMAAFPNPKLHMVCTFVITIIGLCVAYFNVSIKDPNADKKLQQPDVKP